MKKKKTAGKHELFINGVKTDGIVTEFSAPTTITGSYVDDAFSQLRKKRLINKISKDIKKSLSLRWSFSDTKF